jgi:RNA polymerase sigma-70 factor (ECF subfamily)
MLQSPRSFATTRQTLVLAAAKGDAEALQTLCRSYWYPLYAYIRRFGHGPQDAEDLTQDFFCRLLEGQQLAAVDFAKGRFRSFLLSRAKNFLLNDRDRAKALKRGGGRRLVSLDMSDAETRYGLAGSDQMTPERLFDRQWAHAVLNKVLAHLREYYVHRNKAQFFDGAIPWLTSDVNAPAALADIARQCKMTPAAAKDAVFRLRRRFADLLRAEIAQTVPDTAQIDEELNYLRRCI